MSKAIVRHRSGAVRRRRHHRRQRAHANPKMKTSTMLLIGGAAVLAIGGGVYYWMKIRPAMVTLTPGAMPPISLSLGNKQALMLSAPAGGSVTSSVATDAGQILTMVSASQYTPVAAGSTSVAVTWQAAGNVVPQVSTLPVTVA